MCKGIVDIPSSQTTAILLLLHDDLLGRSLLVLHGWALLVVSLLLRGRVALGWIPLLLVTSAVAVKTMLVGDPEERAGKKSE